MSAAVEQLHYTWAPRGIEGVNQFQIAAMSPGFKSGPAAAALPMVKRLCRYDPPRGTGELPVSFGWLDFEAQRIAFRRIGLPPEMGKRGNFAAHFLVAPAAALPESTIAAAFEAPFWWGGLGANDEGGEPSLELPVLDAAEILFPAGETDREDLQAGVALAYGIFTKPAGTRLAITAPAEEVGLAVRAAARLVPEALSGLSFSTYEGQPVFPFDLIGADGPAPGMTRCSLSLPADLDPESRLILHSLVEERGLGAIASRLASRSEEGVSGGALWEAARRLLALARGREVDGVGARLLADPAVAGFVCGSAEGRGLVADRICRGEPPVLAAVGAARQEAGSDWVGALGDAVIARYRASGSVAGCAEAVSALGEEAGEAVLDAVFAIVLVDESAASALLAKDAVLVLERAAARRVGTAEARPLLRCVSPHITRCSRDRRVPTDYLATMFEFGLADLRSPSHLVEAARERPGLLEEVRLEGVENERCLDLLRRLDREGKEVLLPTFLYSLSEEPWGKVLRPLVDSLPAVAAARCVLAAAPPRGGPAPPMLSHICEGLASRLLSAPGSTSLSLLERSGSADAVRAVRAIRAAGTDPQTSAEAGSCAWKQIDNPILRKATTEFCFERAVGSVERPEDVTAIWAAIESTDPKAGDMEVLRRLLAYAEGRSRGLAAAEVLGWVARSKIPANPKLVTRLGNIRDREVDESASQVAGQAADYLLEAMEESVKQAGSASRRWWKRLRKKRDD